MDLSWSSYPPAPALPLRKPTRSSPLKFWLKFKSFKSSRWIVILTGSRLNHWMKPMVAFYRTQVSLGSGLWVPLYVRTRHLWNFGDVTLADDDTNSTVWPRFEFTPQVCPKGLFSVLTHFLYFFKLNSCTRQSFHSTFVNHGSKEKSNGLIWIYPPESVKT